MTHRFLPLLLLAACSSPELVSTAGPSAPEPVVAALASAVVEIVGEPKPLADSTYVGHAFRLRNTGKVPLVYTAYGPPVEGQASLIPSVVVVSSEGQQPLSGLWCGTGLGPQTLGVDESVEFEAGWHVDPAADVEQAFRVEVGVTPEGGESFAVQSPVVRL